MNGNSPVNLKLAKLQWKDLKDCIEKLGAEVQFLDQHADLPDMVFAANAGIAYNNQVVLSNFRYPERQPEHDQFKAWFLDKEYTVHSLPKDMTFEGGGDCFVWNNHLIAGWGYRSDKRAVEKAAELLGLSCITLELQDERFYHLDTCMLVVNENTCLYYPGAFLEADIKKLPFNMVPILEADIKKLPFNMVPISESDACMFACNGVKINNNIIAPPISIELKVELMLLGVNVLEVNTSEFLKSGGSARCLVLEI
jgi:N-dimethylarginine dimethylaminohydrolase